MHLGRRVEIARLEQRLTRSQLSKRLGISEGSLRDLEILNSTPRGLQEILPKISITLNKSIGFLLTGKTSDTTSQILAEVDKIIVSANQIKKTIE
jgi:transcriptional regulator with XRE-family HTH domain